MYNITYMVLGAVRYGFLETKSAPLLAGAYFAPPLYGRQCSDRIWQLVLVYLGVVGVIFFFIQP